MKLLKTLFNVKKSENGSVFEVVLTCMSGVLIKGSPTKCFGSFTFIHRSFFKQLLNFGLLV